MPEAKPPHLHCNSSNNPLYELLPVESSATKLNWSHKLVPMGTVHDLIEQQGKQAALLVEADRRAVEAAASYLADEETGIVFLYPGWAQAALPHKRLADDEEWQIRPESVNMLVQPGLRTSNVGRAEK